MLKSKVLGLGLAGLMAIFSVVPAMAAPYAFSEDKVTAKDVKGLEAGDNGAVYSQEADTNGQFDSTKKIIPSAKDNFEKLEDYESSKAGLDMYAPDNFSGKVDRADADEFNHGLYASDEKKVEIALQSAASYSVRIPAFISLQMEDNAGDEIFAGVYRGFSFPEAYVVGVKADVPATAVIDVRPSMKNITDQVLDSAGNKAATLNTNADFDATYKGQIGADNIQAAHITFDELENNAKFKKGYMGLFKMHDDAKVKADLIGTMKLNDTTWTIKADDEDANGKKDYFIGAPNKKTDFVYHKGDIDVGNSQLLKIPAGTYRSTEVVFDITYDNSLGHPTSAQQP